MARVSKYSSNEYLAPREYDYPELIKRYIGMYRNLKGVNAKRNTAASARWFANRVSKDTNHRAGRVHDILMRENGTRRPQDKYIIGRLYLFAYYAKHAAELPVWDAYPLVFFFNAFVGDGVQYGEKGVQYLRGINMHYLPPALRARLFVDLVKLKNDSTLRNKTRLKLTWRTISALASSHLAQHAVKTYRADHVKSELAEVKPDQWEVVIPLQIAQWQKGTKAQAWKMK